MPKAETISDSSVVSSPHWTSENLEAFQRDDPEYRLLEVDIDPSVYGEWHVPGATSIDWEADLGGKHGQNIVSKDGFEELLEAHGITEDSTVVIYGDKANWFAAHAYWLFTYYGHDDVSLLNGGRHYWEREGFPTTTELPSTVETTYSAEAPDDSVRAFRDDVKQAIEQDRAIIDVRSPKAYQGDETAPPGFEESTDTGGHIPTAENVPWANAVRADGRFKPISELADVYGDVGDDDDAVTYCRIGERSSLTWFVLHELLGKDAANYDGSWTDWSSQDDPTIERGN